MFGTSAPILQKMTIHILSQTTSSFGCEKKWSVFEHIDTKKRNRLEHQRLNDLVYVTYNLCLKDKYFKFFMTKQNSKHLFFYFLLNIIDFLLYLCFILVGIMLWFMLYLFP